MTKTTVTKTATALGGQSAFYLLGSIFTLVVGFPLQIYIARVLGAEGLGIFSLIDAGVTLMASLIAFGLAPTLVKFIPLHLARSEFSCVRRLVKRAFFFLLLSSVFSYLILLLALPYLVQYWSNLQNHRSSLIAMGVLIPIGTVLFFLQQALRGFQEVRFMVIGSSFIQLIVKVILSILALSLGYHLLGYIVAVVASTACAVTWMAFGLWRKLKSLPLSSSTCTQDSQKAWFEYAKVIYVGSLIGMLTVHLDRFLLGSFVGAESVGILVVIKQLQLMPVIFLQMFLAVLAPMLSDAHARGDTSARDHLYHLSIDWVVRLSLPLFIFLFVFAEQVLKLYGNKFADDGIYALWIILAAQLFSLVTGPVGMVMNMSGQENKMLKLIAWQTFILLILMVILLPVFGILGAAIAIGLNLIFINITCYFSAKNNLNISWYDKKYLYWIKPTGFCFSAAVIARLFFSIVPNAYILFSYLIALYVIFHAVFLIQGLHDDDKEFIRHIVNKFS